MCMWGGKLTCPVEQIVELWSLPASESLLLFTNYSNIGWSSSASELLWLDPSLLERRVPFRVGADRCS